MSIEYETRRFESGDVIFREGSDADGFYVLQSGRVEIVVEGPNSAQLSLAYVEEGDSFGEMSIVDATPRTATAIACDSCVTMFFQRGMLDQELERAELITFLFRNVCRKLAEQNREVSEHSYIDLQSNNRPRQDYQSNLSLEPISTRMERYLGTKRIGVPRLPFTVGNAARGAAVRHSSAGLWFDAAKIKEFKKPHFQFVRQENLFFVRDLSGKPGTLVNDQICRQDDQPGSIALRRGFNQIAIPGRGADFGFLAYVH
ncbi:MAG: cyclic nucleotide-binding domain-containing protein [Proteobacteria bacterium]|nr:cyclic nucleotide-binding domain-containing protein [Pseudomonadota bacterium]